MLTIQLGRARPLLLAGGALAALVASLAACSPTPADREPTAGPSYSQGPITEAEYLSIVRAVHTCMVDKGYDVGDVERRPDGVTYGFGFSGAGTATGSPAGSVDLVECEGRFGLMEAELAYQDYALLSGAEREAVYAQFLTCLDSAGVTGVTSLSNAVEVGEAIAAVEDAGGDTAAASTCWSQYSTQLFGSIG